MIKPSEEQAKVIACEESAVISARPGSGKTFTMARMIVKASERLLSYQGVVAISYTRKASTELRDRCSGLGVRAGNSFFGTIDAFCLAMIIQQFVPHVVGRMVEIDIVDDDQSLPASRIKDHWVKPQRGPLGSYPRRTFLGSASGLGFERGRLLHGETRPRREEFPARPL